LSQARGIVAAIMVTLLALPLASVDAARTAPARKVARAKSKPSPAPETCDSRKFRIVLDVGHTSESQGATSARNDVEFG